MKKWVPIFAGVFALSVLAFVIKPLVKHPPEINKVFPPHPDLDPLLYPLYINNTDSNRKFRRLIATIDGANIQSKLVFQFLFTKNGKLTMGVYSGPKNHQADFPTTLEIKLKIYDSCTPVSTIANKVVYLGDLEIAGEDGNLGELSKIANDPLNKFIIFIPELHLDVLSGRTCIKYTIFTSDNLNKNTICSLPATLFAGATATGMFTNPSPPRKGN